MNFKKATFIDYYHGGVETEDLLPEGTKYDFLRYRNEGYMDYTALSFNEQKISYRELHQHIDEYARALYSYGVRQGTFVGLCMLNTPETVYTLYALDKLGAVVIGLSIFNNVAKMKKDLDMTKPPIVICAEPFLPIVIEAGAEQGIDVLYLPMPMGTDFQPDEKADNLLELVERKKDADVEYGKYVPNAVTDILFTGGSTGNHKGVDLAGNGLNCVVKALDHVLVLEAGMIHLGNIPMIHMAFGQLVLHYALCKNLEFALTLKALPNDFYNELVRTQAHGAMGGPVHWEALVGTPDMAENSLSNLIQPLSGGEYFKPESQEEVNHLLKGAGCRTGIGEGLGLTEMWAPTHVCMFGKNTPYTIGYPIPFVKSKIVDPETFEAVENGKEGLLFVSGPGMMLRYHDNEEETSKVIVNEEETSKVIVIDSDGIRWYNTGDLAVKLDSGEYRYIGRKKRNFVCGVDNIYPEQIESLLIQIENITEAAVTKVPDKKMQYLPKYHILLKDGSCDRQQLEVEIRDLISRELGESACPGYMEYFSAPLPRTDNGKIDFSRLEQGMVD